MFIMPKYCAIKPVARQTGISLIELMVGVVIGMVTVLVVANTIILSEEQRRGTTTGNDAQNNATVSTYLIERELRMAGYGIYTKEANGISELCSVGTVRTYNKSRTTATDINYNGTDGTAANFLPFVPVFINPPAIPAGDLNSDVVFLNYSNGSLAVVSTGVKFGTSSAPAAGEFKINASEDSLGGFRTGDLMLAVESGRDCTLHEVTGPNPVVGDTVQHGTASYLNEYKKAIVSPDWNKAGGLGIAYTASAMLYNLGAADQFTSVAYAVRSGQLTRCNLMSSPCLDNTKTADPTIWVPIANNIVALRAEMGVDTGIPPDLAIDTWRERPCIGATCTPSFDDWQRVMAMRIAIVARSTQYVKEEVTSAAPTWQGQTAIDLSHLGTDWKHFRYGTVELMVPIRNIVLWSTL